MFPSFATGKKKKNVHDLTVLRFKLEVVSFQLLYSITKNYIEYYVSVQHFKLFRNVCGRVLFQYALPLIIGLVSVIATGFRVL